MPSTEILRIRNCIHITVILYFHLELMSKSVGLKILGLKLIKKDCKIIILHLDAIIKARNKLDGGCCLTLVLTKTKQKQTNKQTNKNYLTTIYDYNILLLTIYLSRN